MWRCPYGEPFNTPSKRKDGRLWKENRCLLSKGGENVYGRTSRMLSNLDIPVKNAAQQTLTMFKGTDVEVCDL